MRMLLAALCAVASLAAAAFAPSAASAQTARTFVSGVGDDANPCSRTAPCRTFAGAIAKTSEGGVVSAIDSANYGPLAITKGITIRADGEDGSISGPAGGAAIVVNAPGRQVNLIGLELDGFGTAAQGIRVTAAAQVLVENCRILGFRNSTGAGVQVTAATAIRVTIRNSTISDNLVGLDVAPTGSGAHSVLLDDVVLDASGVANIRADRKKAAVSLRRSTAVGSPILLTNGADLRSFGDNAIDGGQPTTLTKLK